MLIALRILFDGFRSFLRVANRPTIEFIVFIQNILWLPNSRSRFNNKFVTFLQRFRTNVISHTIYYIIFVSMIFYRFFFSKWYLWFGFISFTHFSLSTYYQLILYYHIRIYYCLMKLYRFDDYRKKLQNIYIFNDIYFI